MGKWVGILIAETGCAEMPDHKVDSTYMGADAMDNLLTTAKQAFNSRQESIRSKDVNKVSVCAINIIQSSIDTKEIKTLFTFLF